LSDSWWQAVVYDITRVAHHFGREFFPRFVFISPIHAGGSVQPAFWDLGFCQNEGLRVMRLGHVGLEQPIREGGGYSGLITLIALIAILVYGFKFIGRMRKQVEGDKQEERFIAAIGASLFANLAAFFGISFFDRTIVAWSALLAIIAAATLAVRIPQPVIETVATGGQGAKFRPALSAPAMGAPSAIHSAAAGDSRSKMFLQSTGTWGREGA
jgi:hypothetical protein